MPLPGHGAEIAIEAVGAAAGVFTVIGELTSELGYNLTRETKRVRAHDHTVSRVLTSPQMDVESISFDMAFNTAAGMHDVTTGLEALFLGVGGSDDSPDTFGLRLRGRGASAGSDEFVATGELSAFSKTSPIGAEERTASATFNPNGIFEVNGTVFGS